MRFKTKIVAKIEDNPVNIEMETEMSPKEMLVYAKEVRQLIKMVMKLNAKAKRTAHQDFEEFMNEEEVTE